MFFAPIVEGAGEVLSVERLLWRIAQEVAPGHRITVNQPIRVKSGTFLNDGRERDRHVQLAAAKARRQGGCVLVLLDCEDDCPAELGPRLMQQVSQAAGPVDVLIALAVREYETWFIAAVESLRGIEGLAGDAQAPASPEASRDAKGWLGRLMPHRYDPVVHQLAFTKVFDLKSARRVPSFDRLCRRVGDMMARGTDATGAAG